MKNLKEKLDIDITRKQNWDESNWNSCWHLMNQIHRESNIFQGRLASRGIYAPVDLSAPDQIKRGLNGMRVY